MRRYVTRQSMWNLCKLAFVVSWVSLELSKYIGGTHDIAAQDVERLAKDGMGGHDTVKPADEISSIIAQQILQAEGTHTSKGVTSTGGGRTDRLSSHSDSRVSNTRGPSRGSGSKGHVDPRAASDERRGSSRSGAPGGPIRGGGGAGGHGAGKAASSGKHSSSKTSTYDRLLHAVIQIARHEREQDQRREARRAAPIAGEPDTAPARGEEESEEDREQAALMARLAVGAEELAALRERAEEARLLEEEELDREMDSLNFGLEKMYLPGGSKHFEKAILREQIKESEEQFSYCEHDRVEEQGPVVEPELEPRNETQAELEQDQVFIHRGNVYENLHRDVWWSQAMKTDNATLAAILPASWEAIRQRFRLRSCGVVGNSGILAFTSLGPAIDSHTLVARLNQAPVRGYKHLVGARTTMRVLNHKWAMEYSYGKRRIREGELPLERGAALVVTRSDGELLLRLRQVLHDLGREDVALLFLSQRVVRLAREFERRFRQAMCDAGVPSFKGGIIPSTGFVAAYAMLHLCDRLSLYGYHYSLQEARDADLVRQNGTSAFADAQGEDKAADPAINITGPITKYHYFDGAGHRFDHRHSPGTEHALLEKLRQRGDVEMCGYDAVNHTVPSKVDAKWAAAEPLLAALGYNERETPDMRAIAYNRLCGLNEEWAGDAKRLKAVLKGGT